MSRTKHASNHTISLTDEEEALIRRAMDKEHISGLAPFMRRATLLYAEQVVFADQTAQDLANEFKAFRRATDRQMAQLFQLLEAKFAEPADDTQEIAPKKKSRSRNS